MNFIQRLFSGNANFKNIRGEQVQALIKENKNMLILDVRTSNEYKSGHIPKSKNIPITELQLKINSIKKYQDKPILVYCASGARSRRASNILSKSGFTNLYNLSRGINSDINII